MTGYLCMKKRSGFTLVELLTVVMIIGVITVMMGPTFYALMTAQESAYLEKHRLNNQLIGVALLNYAAHSTQYGRLPLPYTGGGYTKTIYNPGDTTAAGIALTQTLTQSGINPVEINDDGKAAKNVRVYQLATPLSLTMPLYFLSGPKVTLTYDYGAIYLTACSIDNNTCNPTASSGIPGSSPVLTAINFNTWTTGGTDGPAFFISSLPLQKQMMVTTAQRLDKVRDSLLSYFRAQQITAAGGDDTNWYPNETGAAAAGSKTGQTPANNQECRDGWYDLSNASIKVLPTAGLAPEEFGKTAWGGTIEYCRDYDPTGVQTPDAPPHYAAIRMLKNVSIGGTPDASIAANNIVLTF